MVPVEAIAGANILHQWLPLPHLAARLGLMAVMTAVNLMSARSYAEFEFWFASIKVAAIIVFIALDGRLRVRMEFAAGPDLGNLTATAASCRSGPISVLATAVDGAVCADRRGNRHRGRGRVGASRHAPWPG